MKCEIIPNHYSQIIEDYLSKTNVVRDFYKYIPDMDGLKKATENRNFDVGNRKILVEKLSDVYHDILPNVHPEAKSNIEALRKESTFTITTGHQLSLFTGPLFFIYKILSTIKLAKQLSEELPEYTFVPVYWMASEDHDFEEINHFHLFNKKYTWESGQTGAVGEFDLSDLSGLLEELTEEAETFKDCYESSKTLSEATFKLVDKLFGKYGLVIIEPDNRELKKVFVPYMEKELFDRPSFTTINETSEKLDSLGYKTQVTPREINLFYKDQNIRERIVEEGENFKVLNTDLVFTREQIKAELENSPERFSPNVVMRPLYQEVILPNIAYIGGPGELAYWLQLQSNFETFEVPFPVLVLRDSFLVINGGTRKNLDKLELSVEELFEDLPVLKKKVITNILGEEVSLEDVKGRILKEIDSIKDMLKDKSLEGSVEAEKAKVEKGLDNLEKRIQKSEERLHDTSINQLEKLKEKLFPEGGPQERIENVLNYLINQPDFIEEVYEHANPLQRGLKVLYL